jgi:hypothetical protein
MTRMSKMMSWCNWNGDPESYQEWADACGMPAVWQITGPSLNDSDSCTKHLGPYVAWLVDIGFTNMEVIKVEFGPVMVGFEVVHVAADDYHGAGYVAHAKCSDGTLSFPIGAESRLFRVQAERDTKRIRWSSTGPYMETDNANTDGAQAADVPGTNR